MGGEVDKHRDKYHFQLQQRIFGLAISIIPPSPVKRYIQIQEQLRHKSSKTAETLYSCINRDIEEKKKPVDNLFENEIGCAVKG